MWMNVRKENNIMKNNISGDHIKSRCLLLVFLLAVPLPFLGCGGNAPESPATQVPVQAAPTIELVEPEPVATEESKSAVASEESEPVEPTVVEPEVDVITRQFEPREVFPESMDFLTNPSSFNPAAEGVTLPGLQAAIQAISDKNYAASIEKFRALREESGDHYVQALSTWRLGWLLAIEGQSKESFAEFETYLTDYAFTDNQRGHCLLKMLNVTKQGGANYQEFLAMLERTKIDLDTLKFFRLAFLNTEVSFLKIRSEAETTPENDR